MSYIEVFDENYSDEVLDEKEMPVLVDFWAPWCQPCQMLAPVIDEIADELDGTVKVCKLNCDEAGDKAMENGVMSIPCLILFVAGEERDRLVGLHSKDEVIAFIERNK
ncbi:MAG: thioredoxin [Acutalibacteraceae bacterium]|nr:thioredoxin [Acutalibacteraceae bacterium]